MLTTAIIERLLKPYQYPTAPQREKGKARMRREQLQHVVLEIIRLNGYVDSEILAKKIGVTVECANKNLRKLRDDGLIVAQLISVTCRSDIGVTTTTRKNRYKARVT